VQNSPTCSTSIVMVEFNTNALLPKQWKLGEPGHSFRVYNPAITRHSSRLILACRVDSIGHGGTQRRIAICALDDQLRVVPNSVVPLSDTVREGGIWHYDPRFLVYQDRLFVHYNNNFMTRPNQIYMVELDPDTLEAKSSARPLHIDSPRQEIEKNWMLFEYEGDLYAVYSITPHIILRIDLAGAGPVVCRPAFRSEWNVAAYVERYGNPRGGAPPVRCGDMYMSFYHSRRPVSRLNWVLRYWPVAPDTKLPRYLAAIERRLRRPFAQVCYFAGAYAFEAAPPFRPVWHTKEPVLRPENETPRRRRVRANPSADGIVYPCGAVSWEDGSWIVSYGLHDESCCLRRVWLPGSTVNAVVFDINGCSVLNNSQ